MRQFLGVLLCFVAVVMIGASIDSLFWQLQTRLCYTQGQCRVVAAEIEEVGSGFELAIRHRVEIEGKQYRETRNTEQYTPASNDRRDAEELLARYPLGSLQPCWYDARDPDRHSVLIRNGMDTPVQLLVFGLGLATGGLGGWLALRNSKPSNRK